MTGAGRTLKASIARRRGARERLALPRRRTSARARDRPAARLPRLVHAAPPARPARPDRDLQRPLDGRRSAGAARGRVRRQRRRDGAARGCGARSSRASSTPTGPRSGSSADRFTDRTIVICAEDNLGKGAAGQAIQNVNRALGLDDTAGLRLARGARSSHVGDRRTGVRRERRRGRDPAVGPARRRGRALRAARGRRRDVDDEPRPGRPGDRLPAPPRARAAPGRADQRRLSRTPPPGAQGEADAVASADGPRRASSASRPRRCSCSRPA